jgi:hypothetical protein
MIEQDKLINDLISKHKKVLPLLHPFMRSVLWLFAQTIILVLIMDFFHEIKWGRLLEINILSMLVLMTASVTLVVATFYEIVPGKKTKILKVLGVIAFITSLFIPNSQAYVSRPFCEFEILVFTTICNIVLFYFLQKGLVASTGTRLLFICFTAGILPVTLMQVFCKTEIAHAITWHLMPLLIAGILQYAFFRKFLSTRRIK